MSRLSAVVIALNEEKNVRDLLANLSFCDEVIWVDSGSSDRTAALAKQGGAKVFERPFDDFASQKNFGISQAGGEWVFLIDADERVTPELAVEIRQTVKSPRMEFYRIRRKNRIFGRWMEHGINAHDWQLRLAATGKARFEGQVHERVRALSAPGRLKNLLLHYSTDSISSYMKKLLRYTELEVSSLRASGKKMEKTDMMLRPLARFGKMGVLQRGLLDGMPGFLFTVLSAYYEFVRRVKWWEKNK